jgi:hypothetical protein
MSMHSYPRHKMEASGKLDLAASSLVLQMCTDPTPGSGRVVMFRSKLWQSRAYIRYFCDLCRAISVRKETVIPGRAHLTLVP